MTLVFTKQHQLFRTKIAHILDEAVVPFLGEWEREGYIPRSLFRTFGETGITGILIPQELGGSGLDFSYNVIFIEELMKRRAASIGSSLLLQLNTVCPMLVRFGSKEIQRKFLPGILRGETIVSFAVTEPSGGSNLLDAVQATAERDGDEWVISGEKMFISNAPIADVIFALVRTKAERGPFSMSVIAIPSGTPGVNIEDMEKWGLDALRIGNIRFHQCRVPLTNMVGRIHQGYLQISNALFDERFVIGMGSILLARTCLDDTISYLKKRTSGGQPIIKNQAIRHELSNLMTEVEAGRAFAYSVADKLSRGHVDKARICIAKYALTERAQLIVKRCMQLHGGYGFSEHSWLDRAIRDIRVMSIYAGTSETMRELASVNLLPKLYSTPAIVHQVKHLSANQS